MVPGAAGDPLELRLVLQRGGEVRLERTVQGPLREADGERSGGGKPARERPRLVHQRVGRHHPVHEADAFRVRRAHRVGREHHLGRARVPHEPRQEPGRAGVRYETHAAEDLDERRRLRRDAEVARERDGATGARRDPVDGADDRLLQATHGEDERVIALAKLRAKIR